MRIETKMPRKLGKKERLKIVEALKEGKVNSREFWEENIIPYRNYPYTGWVMQMIKKYKIGSDSYYIESVENKGRKEIITYHFDAEVWKPIEQEKKG